MLKSLIKYISKDIKTIILFVVVFIAILMMILDFMGWSVISNYREKFWSQVISTYIAFGAFIFSIAIWVSTLFKEWKNSLPKRLSVYFVMDNQCLMQCNYAFLSGEADIRQTAQQIGAQIADLRFLNFNIANVQSKELNRVYSGEDVNRYADAKSMNYPFRHYCAVIHLTSPPATLDKNCTYLWQPPFNINLDEKDKEQLDKSVLAKKLHVEENKEGDPPRVIRLSYNFKKEIAKLEEFNVELFYEKVKQNKGIV